MRSQPEPPYTGHPMSPRWREVPFEKLPVGLQRRLLLKVEDTEGSEAP